MTDHSRQIGVFILAKDEEANIARCLDALASSSWPVHVLDSGSTDNTKNIVESFPFTILQSYCYSNHCNAFNEIATNIGSQYRSIGNQSFIGERALTYNLGPITIGSRATISQHVHLCAGTHDYTDPSLPLLKPPIVIADQAWVCADTFVGLGVKVGEGAIVGARAVVTKDVEPWAILVGNPAKFVKERQVKKRMDDDQC